MWHEVEHTEGGKELAQTFEFVDFSEAFSFCTRVAMIAEKLNHHPSLNIEYNKVQITTTTHDAGNSITEKDRKLVAEIDKIKR